MEVETADKQKNNIIIDLINVIKNKTTEEKEEATNTNSNQLDNDELKQSLMIHLMLIWVKKCHRIL